MTNEKCSERLTTPGRASPVPWMITMMRMLNVPRPRPDRAEKQHDRRDDDDRENHQRLGDIEMFVISEKPERGRAEDEIRDDVLHSGPIRHRGTKLSTRRLGKLLSYGRRGVTQWHPCHFRARYRGSSLRRIDPRLAALTASSSETGQGATLLGEIGKAEETRGITAEASAMLLSWRTALVSLAPTCPANT